MRKKLPKNCREVSAICCNNDGSYIATADKSNDHMVTVWNSGGAVWTEKGGPDHIFDMSFTKGDKNEFWSAGVKHFMHWNID